MVSKDNAEIYADAVGVAIEAANNQKTTAEDSFSDEISRAVSDRAGVSSLSASETLTRLERRIADLKTLQGFFAKAPEMYKVGPGAELVITFEGEDQPDRIVIVPETIESVINVPGVPTLIQPNNPLITAASKANVGESFTYQPVSQKPGRPLLTLSAKLDAIE